MRNAQGRPPPGAPYTNLALVEHRGRVAQRLASAAGAVVHDELARLRVHLRGDELRRLVLCVPAPWVATGARSPERPCPCGCFFCGVGGGASKRKPRSGGNDLRSLFEQAAECSACTTSRCAETRPADGQTDVKQAMVGAATPSLPGKWRPGARASVLADLAIAMSAPRAAEFCRSQGRLDDGSRPLFCGRLESCSGSSCNGPGASTVLGSKERLVLVKAPSPRIRRPSRERVGTLLDDNIRLTRRDLAREKAAGWGRSHGRGAQISSRAPRP